MSVTHDALALVGILAVVGSAAIVARSLRVESRRPSQASDWSESPWGDVPNVPVHSSPVTDERR